MYNEDGKLIIIHEYDTPTTLQPFLNPVCKDTYNALPKIYGRQHKKRYLSGPHSAKNTEQSRYLRDCCHEKYQHDHRSHSDIKTVKKGKVKPMQSENKITTFKRSFNKAKVKRFAPHMSDMELPILKGFSNGQLVDEESRHKVYRPKRMSSLDAECKSDSRGKGIKQEIVNDVRGSKVRTQFGNSDESVQTEERFFALVDNKNASKRTKTEDPRADYRNFYEYLEGGAKKEEEEVKQQPSSRLNKKDSTSSRDESFSIASSTLRKKKDSTMFHRFKKKFEDGPRKKPSNASSRNANSILSNGLFKIPQQQQYGDYIMSYKPMDSNFDIRTLVKEADFHIVSDQGKVYFGQIRDNKRHGRGVTISERQIYEGRYDRDVKVEGYQKNRDGVYVGDYFNGKRHGKGRFAWYNGQTFEGEWRNGKKNGYGVWKSPKGDYYEGQWVENRQNGQGYHYHIGGSKYRGQFKDFLKHGRGQQQFPNGDLYVGQYKEGRPHGQGKYTWHNKDSYDGQFQQGSRSGYGVLKSKDCIYQGYFKNDEKHGEGRQRYTKTGQSFEGEFMYGERHRGTLKTREGKLIQVTE